MADQRDEIAQSLIAQNTGGLTPQDFAAFSSKLNNPEALQGWLDKGGIYGQMGLTPPDPDEQYFANKGVPSGSATETGWMAARQPWQQGGYAGGETTNSIPGAMGGWIGGASMTRADPAYWGWQGPRQGYAAGSMGDISGFNAGRGGGAGGTGGLTPQDFAVFSRLVSPQALQEWLNAGGVQGQFGGSMGGGGGGGGGGGSSGGGGGASGGSSSGGVSGSGVSGSGQGPSSSGISAQGPASSGAPSVGYGYGPPGTPSADGVNSIGGSTAPGWGGLGAPGFGIGETGYTGQPGFGLGIGTMGTPGQGTSDGWGYGASEGDPSGSGAW